MNVVQWTLRARDELVDCWLRSDSPARARITREIADLEHMLSYSPHQVGEGRSAEWRIAFLESLVLDFRVVEGEHLVLITHVRTRLRR